MLESSSITFVKQSATLTFTPNFSYSYQTNIIFFFYDEFAQIVSTQVYLSFMNDLPNFVSKRCKLKHLRSFQSFVSQLELDLSVTTTEPGKNVSLCVSSAINSQASLLAIDQSELINDNYLADFSSFSYRELMFLTSPIDLKMFTKVVSIKLTSPMKAFCCWVAETTSRSMTF